MACAVGGRDCLALPKEEVHVAFGDVTGTSDAEVLGSEGRKESIYIYVFTNLQR